MTVAEYKVRPLGELANLRHQPASPTTFAHGVPLIDVMAHATTRHSSAVGTRLFDAPPRSAWRWVRW